MDIKKELATFKGKIDREIGLFLDQEIKNYSQKDKAIARSLKYVKENILSGGKRLRAALMFEGYVGCGGKNRREILKTCVSIELIHAFLLIHDDIMDRDTLRHGKDTLNNTYTKIGRRLFSQGDSEHFGNSMAIIVGDMIAALGNQVIYNSHFDSKFIVRTLHKLQDIVALTVVGQAKDLMMGYKKKAKEKEVLTMYEFKTSRYTLEGPLHLGGMLAGASQKVLREFSQLSIPLGIAFQIQDDILGVFGSEEKIGKPVGSDIQEGKQTILVVKALSEANQKQKEEMYALLGKEKLSWRDIKKFRGIIIETGSLKYAQDLAKKMIQKGKNVIAKMEIRKETQDFLLGVADYMMNREV